MTGLSKSYSSQETGRYRIMQTATFLLVFLILTACAFQGATQRTRRIVDLYPEFERHVDACSASHQFDPKVTHGVGEHDLKLGENAWRGCVYKGVEQIIVPNTDFPELYRRIIEEDRDMTERIARREVTRIERRTRIEWLVQLIETNEAYLRQGDFRQARDIKDMRERQEIQKQIEWSHRQAIDAARAIRSIHIQ
jgi:hypothetical protein